MYEFDENTSRDACAQERRMSESSVDDQLINNRVGRAEVGLDGLKLGWTVYGKIICVSDTVSVIAQHLSESKCVRFVKKHPPIFHY